MNSSSSFYLRGIAAHFTFFHEEQSGAKDGIRTRDPWYHKPVL